MGEVKEKNMLKMGSEAGRDFFSSMKIMKMG
jgi:hypothetical protein